MNARLIASDEELLIVFGILFAALKEGFKNGKSFVFPPEKFVLPEEKIEVNDKNKFLMKETVNFRPSENYRSIFDFRKIKFL